ncbi:MAG: SDR family oxidoreductase [Bacteroidia bacterium]|nr:SDR family oxidoreductase [Bacteroidia bacterium]
MSNNNKQTVVITGASSGIGKALAQAYSAQGYQVVINGRTLQTLETTRKELEKYGNKVLVVTGDVAIEKDCKTLIDKTIEEFGRLDILINNAGISMRAVFKDMELSVIERVMAINFWGTVYCTKYALPYLLESKGSVVGISSIAGYKGLPGRTGYSASKFAMQGFLESLRLENLNTGLHVLIACPGYTASNIRNVALSADGSAQGETPFEEGNLMSAEEVASHIVSSVRSRKDRLVLTRQGKLLVFLNKFFPKWVDHLVYNTVSKEANSPFK